MNELIRFIEDKYKVGPEIFYAALKMSPNAQGYIMGSISELLLINEFKALGYQVRRVKEKWEGKKHANHHGDFYFKKGGTDEWYVLESKGVKSNSEKWHKLYNYDGLRAFMIKHADKIDWIKPGMDIEKQVEDWIKTHLPKMLNEYSAKLYSYSDVKKYKMPKRENATSAIMKVLKELSEEELNRLIDERLEYVMSKVKVLETHFVSGTSGSSSRTQATPRIDEFNLISIDLILRFDQHKFLYANPKLLEPSTSDELHLQQNYIIGFVFNEDGEQVLSIDESWMTDLDKAHSTLKQQNSVFEEDMQIDYRSDYEWEM